MECKIRSCGNFVHGCIMYILMKGEGEGGGKISFFHVFGRDKEFLGKIAYFRGFMGI